MIFLINRRRLYGCVLHGLAAVAFHNSHVLYFMEVVMTGFELVSLAVSVAGVLAGLVAVPAFVLMWIQATEEQKKRFRRFWAKLGQKAYRVWVYLSCAILVATGIGKVTQFATNVEPMTRPDVLLLLMNLMSLTVFSVMSLIVIVNFQLTDKKKSALAPSL